MIRLHHVSFSRSFRTLWLLQEMGITPEIVQYSITDGSMRTPEFLSKSPAGRVPALEIDGRVLFESAAITEYLCETRPEFDLGRPPGHEERYTYLEWLGFAETMAGRIEALNLSWIFLRDPAMRSDTVCKIEAKRLAAALSPIELVLGRQDYVLASGFSAADTMLGFNLMAAPYYVKLDPFPKIQDYIARVEARAAYQSARKLDGPQAFYTKDFYGVEDG